jgi:hypothetical protein
MNMNLNVNTNINQCLDCCYFSKCGIDSEVAVPEGEYCNAFVGLDFDVEYYFIDSDLIDELLGELEDEFWPTDEELERLWVDSSEEWMEMSYRQLDLSWEDRFDDEEGEWEKFLREGDLWVDTN